MKDKIKKIITGTIIGAVALTSVGCGTTGNKLARKIDKSMAEFVTSINNLDYVATTKSTSSPVGKIVETTAKPQTTSASETFRPAPKIRETVASAYNNKWLISSADKITILSDDLSETEIENTIVRPENRNESKIFVLSDIPFVTLTSDDTSTSFLMSVKFSTEKIEDTSTEIDEKINTLILKRSILMIYVNEIYNGNVTLSDENKTAINAYVNVIKENTSFLNGNRGMVKNQLKLASDLVEDNSNENLVNYYIIKSGEALEIRLNKLDSTISAIDSITDIIEENLTENSTYYNLNLSTSYNDIIANLTTDENEEITVISESSTNEEIAKSIKSSLDFFIPLHSGENLSKRPAGRPRPIFIENTENDTRDNETENEANSETENNSEQGIMTLEENNSPAQSEQRANKIASLNTLQNSNSQNINTVQNNTNSVSNGGVTRTTENSNTLTNSTNLQNSNQIRNEQSTINGTINNATRTNTNEINSQNVTRQNTLANNVTNSQTQNVNQNKNAISSQNTAKNNAISSNNANSLNNNQQQNNVTNSKIQPRTMENQMQNGNTANSNINQARVNQSQNTVSRTNQNNITNGNNNQNSVVQNTNSTRTQNGNVQNNTANRTQNNGLQNGTANRTQNGIVQNTNSTRTQNSIANNTTNRTNVSNNTINSNSRTNANNIRTTENNQTNSNNVQNNITTNENNKRSVVTRTNQTRTQNTNDNLNQEERNYIAHADNTKTVKPVRVPYKNQEMVER